jgi:tRNA threonylcarbamoyladenosine biosynthesis protein TsaE
MNRTFRCGKPDELAGVARALLEEYPDERIFAFYGELGAGKTTFIQHVCRELGVIDVVNSPTFAIINEYRTSGGNRVYHLDFYRIKNLEEAFDLGYEDYLFSGDYCLIEWPEKIENLLPPDFVNVSITIDRSDHARIIEYGLRRQVKDLQGR